MSPEIGWKVAEQRPTCLAADAPLNELRGDLQGSTVKRRKTPLPRSRGPAEAPGTGRGWPPTSVVRYSGV